MGFFNPHAGASPSVWIKRPDPAPYCAHLGLAEDPFNRGAHASDEHRCYADLGRERVDLQHQKRFCLASAHASCPFLLINSREASRDWRVEARDWWRRVSPPPQALSRFAGPQVGAFGMLLVQTWRSVRPHHAVIAPEDAKSVPSVCEESHVAEVANSYTEAMDEDASVHFAVAAQPVKDRNEANTHQAAVEVAHVNDVEHSVDRLVEELEVVDDSGQAREWFWRAKNAETLNDVVKCLERAHALEPNNEMISSNLEWARERREAQRQSVRKSHSSKVETAPSVVYVRRGPGVLARLAMAAANLLRTLLALAVFAAGAIVVVNALPERVRHSLLTTTDIPLPDTSGLASLVHVPLSGGYDLGTALPYVLGFMALFIARGLLRREPSPAGRDERFV